MGVKDISQITQKFSQNMTGNNVTPQKNSAVEINLSHRSGMRRHKSIDRTSNNNVSQGGLTARSPGQKSGSNLSVHKPNKYILKSTKKLTRFREFNITPTSITPTTKEPPS